MKTNDAGIALIKQFEGCRLHAYKDIVGVWTIGYGHTGGVSSDWVWTQAECEERLAKDLESFEAGVSKLVTLPITPNQFAAMVSFAFNLGLDKLKASTLLRCFNKHNAAAAADEFLKWCHAGGVVVEGLVKRRQAERTLFLTP